MDAESLAQIERIVIGTEGRLQQELHGKIDALETSFRKELGERTEKIGARVEEVRQYSGVLHEDMNTKLGLVLEGFEGLRQGQAALRQMIVHESLEMQSLLKLSYRQLQERVETLEQRVQIIEKRVGLSG